MPSQRDGRTTRSAAAYQGAVSRTAPAKSTEGGAPARSRAASGPSPTSTRRASGTSWRTRGQARSRMSCPFCRQSRPTHTTRGVCGGSWASRGSAARAAAVGASPPASTSAGRKRSTSTPLWTTDQGARTPARSPRSRSASLTQTTRAVQRAASRSQPRARAAVVPPTASKDQACGWNTVGIRPRTARRPAKPAFALCACTTSGRIRPTSSATRRISAGSANPGSRVACQTAVSAPSAATSAASGPPRSGQATTTRVPAVTCAWTRSVTTRATPPSTGWTRWSTVKPGPGLCLGGRTRNSLHSWSQVSRIGQSGKPESAAVAPTSEPVQRRASTAT